MDLETNLRIVVMSEMHQKIVVETVKSTGGLIHLEDPTLEDPDQILMIVVEDIRREVEEDLIAMTEEDLERVDTVIEEEVLVIAHLQTHQEIENKVNQAQISSPIPPNYPNSAYQIPLSTFSSVQFQLPANP
jgi:tripartite-type tricarboxylate transporter receptor subunit TctC